MSGKSKIEKHSRTVNAWTHIRESDIAVYELNWNLRRRNPLTTEASNEEFK
nr:hypothetical protein [Alicyclobacillus fastidiosus]